MKDVKHLFNLPIIMIAILLSVVMVSSALINAETIKYQYRMSEKGASVNFYEYSMCHDAFGSLYVFESMYKENPGAPLKQGPMGFFDLWSIDWCAMRDRQCFGEINMDSLTVSASLMDAHAVGTGTVTCYECDWISGCSEYQEVIEVDVAWTGVSEVMRGHYCSHSNDSGYGVRRISQNRSNGNFRDASAIGSISGNMGTDITLEPSSSYFSQISNWNSGYMNIEVYKP